MVSQFVNQSVMKKTLSNPVIVILGATGVGKSKLAIDVAKEFNGEIINADAMQMYKGLNILTNKISEKDQMNIPHHMLSCVCPFTNPDFNITNFKSAAIKLIEDISKRNKLPVIVGGTNYYIEALLWDFVLPSSKSSTTIQTSNFINTNDLTDYERLKQIDLESALRIHPNDVRKVKRALEVYEQSGETKSSLLKKQKLQHNQSPQLGDVSSFYKNILSGPLRFKDLCMIWVQCSQDVLDERLDKRVDTMLEDGLIEELLAFHKQYKNLVKSPDFTKGIFQSIGLKEFHEYLIKIIGNGEKCGDNKNGDSEVVEIKTTDDELLLKGITNMKLATRRYARKQIKWIKNRFLSDRGLNKETSSLISDMTSSSSPTSQSSPSHSLSSTLSSLSSTTRPSINLLSSSPLTLQKSPAITLSSSSPSQSLPPTSSSSSLGITLSSSSSPPTSQSSPHMIQLLPPTTSQSSSSPTSQSSTQMTQSSSSSIPPTTSQSSPTSQSSLSPPTTSQSSSSPPTSQSSPPSPTSQSSSPQMTPPLYAVNSTDITKWDFAVKEPTFEIIRDFLKGGILAIKHEPLPIQDFKNPSIHQYCEHCNKIFVKLIDWQIHVTSRKHKKMLHRKKSSSLIITHQRQQTEVQPPKATITADESAVAAATMQHAL